MMYFKNVFVGLGTVLLGCGYTDCIADLGKLEI